MRSALVACLLVAVAAGAALAQPTPGPDEVVLQYLKAVYAYVPNVWTPNDQAHCRAYRMLSAATRERLTPQEFVSTARWDGFVFVRADIGSPRIEGEWATVQVTYVVQDASSGENESDTVFAKLHREDDTWRVALPEDTIARMKQVTADWLRTVRSWHAAKPAPPDVCKP